MQSDPRRKRMTWLLMALILLLGGALRFYGLDIQSLWNDELESWRQSNFGSLVEVIQLGVIPDTHPPLFQSILFYVERYLGDSETWLRLPSAVFGLVAIWLIFLLGKKAFSEREGLIAALFMAVMWAPISISQEARNYSLLVMVTLLAAYFWLDILLSMRDQLPIRGTTYLGYVLGALALLYTHYYGVLLVGLQGFVILLLGVMNRDRLRNIILMLIAIAIGYLPWIPSLLEQATHTNRISWIELPKVTAFPALISFFFNRIEPFAVIVLALYAFLLGRIIWEYRQSPKRGLESLLTSTEFFLGYWLIAPLAVVFIVSYIWTPFLTQRNLLVSLPAAYLLLARAITQLPLKRYLQAGFAVLIAGFAILHLAFFMGYYRFPSKEQYREAVRYVIERNEPYGDTLILGYSRFPDYFNYYFELLGSELSVETILGTRDDTDDFQKVIEARNPEYIWYISAHRMPDEEFLEFLEKKFKVIEEKRFYGATVRLIRVD